MFRRFRNRTQAGRVLARSLSSYANRPDVLVLALPRGGVPVAFQVAKSLGLALDVFVVRKLGVPGQEELAMGAIASGGVRVINAEVVSYLGIPEETINQVAEREQRELERRENLYRGGRPSPGISGRTVILIDDGVATGSSMHAAVTALKQLGAQRIVIAVPVAPFSTYRELTAEVDEVVALELPTPFDGVGRWYDDFSQTSDEEVRRLLDQAAELGAPPTTTSTGA